MAEGRSADFKAHFLGTHFFNPARYLKLLEIIPIQETDPDVLEFMTSFAENTLGKGVVIAKDTPNFIANRIGTYGLLVTVREMLSSGTPHRRGGHGDRAFDRQTEKRDLQNP